MSNRLPIEVNPFRLIEQRRQLTGKIGVDQLPRLQEVLVAAAEDFEVELDFSRTLSQLPMISGKVTGTVALECQRCLEPVSTEVDARISVIVTGSQTDRQPEDEGYEICIIEDERMFLQDFIEDEILLSLPVIPKHETCQPVRPLIEAVIDDVEIEDLPQKAVKNPFAALKDWKKTE